MRDGGRVIAQNKHFPPHVTFASVGRLFGLIIRPVDRVVPLFVQHGRRPLIQGADFGAVVIRKQEGEAVAVRVQNLSQTQMICACEAVSVKLVLIRIKVGRVYEQERSVRSLLDGLGEIRTGDLHIL